MDGAERLFSAAGAVALVGWFPLVFLPRWRGGARFVSGLAVPAALALLYLALAVTQLPAAAGGFGSLAEVALLFEQPWVLLAGWVHYLAFDLFVGAWEARDARRLGVPHLLLVPCLLLTFLLGPVGLVGYLGLRAGLRRAWTVDEREVPGARVAG